MKNNTEKSYITYFVYAFVSVWALMVAYNISVRSPLSVLLIGGLFCFYVHTGKKELPERRWPAAVSSAILTFVMLIVKGYDIIETYDSKLFKLGFLLIMTAGFLILFYHVFNLLCVVDGSRLFDKSEERREMKNLMLFSFLVCFVFYLPWFLFSFPGIFDPDPIGQIEQVLHLRPWSNHHPIAHTLLIALFYHIGGLFTDSINLRIGLYTFFQMCFFAFCASCVINTLYRVVKLKLAACMAVLAFYAAIPFMAVQSIIVCKDVIFAGIVMLFCCELTRIVYEGIPYGKNMIPKIIYFNILGILMSLFRSNGWYVFLLIAVVFIIVYLKEWKKIFFMILPVIVTVCIIKGPVMTACGVEQPDLAEALHVPEQQIARVLYYHRDISEEDRAMLEALTDISRVDELYCPWFADNIKELIRSGNPEILEQNKGAYFKLWLKLGLKYPVDYILAWKDLTENLIYPEGDYDIAVIEGVYKNSFGLSEHPVIAGKAAVKLRELMIKLGSYIPLYGFLWSMGSYTWMLLLTAAAMLSRKGHEKRLIILIPAAAIIATLFLAIPAARLFRYAYSYAVLLPFCACAFSEKE